MSETLSKIGTQQQTNWQNDQLKDWKKETDTDEVTKYYYERPTKNTYWVTT